MKDEAQSRELNLRFHKGFLVGIVLKLLTALMSSFSYSMSAVDSLSYGMVSLPCNCEPRTAEHVFTIQSKCECEHKHSFSVKV